LVVVYVTTYRVVTLVTIQGENDYDIKDSLHKETYEKF